LLVKKSVTACSGTVVVVKTEVTTAVEVIT
jgi:hypothetical protein